MHNNISQTKICVQKILPHHQKHLDNIFRDAHSPEHAQKLQAAFFTSKLWPKDSKIRIGFIGTGSGVQKTNMSGLQNVDPLQDKVTNLSVVDAVKKVVTERIIPLVDLDISFVDNISDANVRVSFDPDGGAWSLIGTDHLQEKTKPTINLGWFDVPTTIHEFGHMLGMIHEHQNPNGENIKWDKQKVFAWAKSTQGWSEQTTETNIIKKYDTNSINGSSFDPLSVMLYFFPADLTLNGVGTSQNLRLSGEDTLWITKIYPKQGGISPAEFYQKTYGISLESSIDASKKAAENFGQGGISVSVHPVILLLLYVFLLFIASLIIYKLFLKRK